MINMENKFIRVHSVQDIIIIVALLAVGCTLALLPVGTSLNLVGYLVIPSALLAFFLLKSEYKNTADNGRYKKKVFNFPTNVENNITEAVAGNPEMIDIKCAENGTALRLDVYYSTSNGKAFLQLFKYVPYQFVAKTELVEYSVDRISTLIK